MKIRFLFSNIFLALGFMTFCITYLYGLDSSFFITFNVLRILGLDLDFSIVLDWIRLTFFGVLSLIVARVLRFSKIYMREDIFETRFVWLVISFVISMTFLIFIPHFFFLLIGWDGLGITSFLLVIYYLRGSSLGAGLKTFLINRIGDRFFIIGLVLFLKKGHWDILNIKSNNILIWIIILGRLTKRAQFPFSSWLPAAMAAPTPVSSLVHSSTLVTAGVYVMIRFSHRIPRIAFLLLGILRLWTIYSASLAATVEKDGKKIVAYSTLSQLGLMVCSISLGLSIFAFFHLITHAVFKALMFICVGYLIKKRSHFQDIRRLNGVWYKNPWICITILCRALALRGFPFLAGFFSKDLIIEKKRLFLNEIFFWLILFSLPLTSYYGLRLVFSLLQIGHKRVYSCKKDKKMLIVSLVPLFTGLFFIGPCLGYWMASNSCVYSKLLIKLLVLSLILIGFLYRWKDIRINQNSLLWFFSSIRFLVPFNRSFWNNKTKIWGINLLKVLDQGAFRKIINSLDTSYYLRGKRISYRYSYFLNPSPRLYMGRIISILFFLNIMWL